MPPGRGKVRLSDEQAPDFHPFLGSLAMNGGSDGLQEQERRDCGRERAASRSETLAADWVNRHLGRKSHDAGSCTFGHNSTTMTVGIRPHGEVLVSPT